ncbi:SRPBCC family protein [Nocardia brevicatena]|uniref:SRPBCC family protein n=1 Tax=Nocardia brevicatena TaxID=37327 RepID=UPI0012F8A48C|nr:SRPBCC family protein [Nocardia brevicatena]
MARRTFRQDVPIAAPAEAVRDRLVRLMNDMLALDPLAVSATSVLSETTTDGATVEHFLVRDRMMFGPLPITFTYRSRVSLDAEGVIEYHTRVPPGIRLHTTLWCEPDGDGVVVRERIDVTAARVLMKTVHTGVVSAQTAVLAKLKESMERTSSAT